MTEPNEQAIGANAPAFTWHPEYQGRTRDSVVRDLAAAIAQDQRQYELALSGAEQEEHQALASIMELEKRWSQFTFDWADSDPNTLAEQVTDFELERDRRREMISYATYRDESRLRPDVPAGTGGRATRTDEERRRMANIGAGLILATIFMVIIVGIIIIL